MPDKTTIKYYKWQKLAESCKQVNTIKTLDFPEYQHLTYERKIAPSCKESRILFNTIFVLLLSRDEGFFRYLVTCIRHTFN